jgi:PAS domain S-box-containing protein
VEYEGRLEEGGFDLILCDFSLPSFDGFSAFALAQERCPAIPFIFLSGAIGEEVAVKALKMGVTDIVSKDHLARLLPALYRALDEAEDRLCREQAEEQFRQIAENVADLIAILDREGRWLYNSPSYRAILGAPEALHGQDSFINIHPEDRARIRLTFQETIQGGLGNRMEFRFLLEDGSVRYIEAQSNVIRQGQGNLTQLLIVSRDITERKHSEERVSCIQAKLEQTNRDLTRRSEEIQSFYHTLSHELKTPLTSAGEFVSIVMDGLAGTLNPTQMEYLGIARESCDQLRVCINDLLDVTRLDTGKMTLELKPVSLPALIHRVVTMMGPVAAGKNIQLSPELEPGLREILLDEHRITQVITNLLNNALKFTPDGGTIRLKVGEDQARPDWVRVSLTDTGRGIAQDHLDRIFDRLYQIKDGDAATGQGIGLGLYICQELVDLHGGHISVESELGKGSTFTFALPRSHRAKRSRVLVIDDDDGMRKGLKQVLEGEEFSVTTADGGNAALQLMQGQLPDLILLDLEMPEMDGAEILRQIRKAWGYIPVILHTGYPDSNLMARALESSPFTLLAKPCGALQLMQAVRGLTQPTNLPGRNGCGCRVRESASSSA